MTRPCMTLRPAGVRSRRGIALPAAVLALVVVGALIAGVFFIARVEQLSAVNTVGSAQAAQTAEAGLASVVGGAAGPYRTLAVGATSAPVVQVLAGSPLDRYTVTVTKLSDDNRYIVESLGERLDGAGTVVGSRRVMQLVRIVGGALSTSPAALTLRGTLAHDSGGIQGNEASLPAWTCPPSGPTVAGILNRGSPPDQYLPGGAAAGLSGSPAIQSYPSLSSAHFEDLGGVSFAEAAAYADVTISNPSSFNFSMVAPQVAGSACVPGPYNWGEPEPVPATMPCQDYFPVIHIQGDVTLTADVRGQGLLLIDGDVTLGGGFRFYGVILALGTVGTVSVPPGTAVVIGSVLAQNPTGAPTLSFPAEVDFRWSSCAVNRALASVGRFVPFTERSWLQLYQ